MRDALPYMKIPSFRQLSTAGTIFLPFPNKRPKPELNPGLTRFKCCGIGTGF